MGKPQDWMALSRVQVAQSSLCCSQCRGPRETQSHTTGSHPSSRIRDRESSQGQGGMRRREHPVDGARPWHGQMWSGNSPRVLAPGTWMHRPGKAPSTQNSRHTLPFTDRGAGPGLELRTSDPTPSHCLSA